MTNPAVKAQADAIALAAREPSDEEVANSPKARMARGYRQEAERRQRERQATTDTDNEE